MCVCVLVCVCVCVLCLRNERNHAKNDQCWWDKKGNVYVLHVVWLGVILNLEIEQKIIRFWGGSFPDWEEGLETDLTPLYLLSRT